MVAKQADQATQASELCIRRAAKYDLDDLARIAQAAFPDDPEFDYRFPYRYRFPEDNWKWTRKEYEEYLDQPEKYVVLVATIKPEDPGRMSRKPVALAVWDMSVLTKSKGGDLGLYQRRDANWAHMVVYNTECVRNFNKFFGKYGKEQYHLWLLATHPDFRRHGAGTLLCRWGMDQAAEANYRATVMGSPMGTKLYRNLDFVDEGTFIVQIPGEEEKVIAKCLTYN